MSPRRGPDTYVQPDTLVLTALLDGLARLRHRETHPLEAPTPLTPAEIWTRHHAHHHLLVQADEAKPHPMKYRRPYGDALWRERANPAEYRHSIKPRPPNAETAVERAQ